MRFEALDRLTEQLEEPVGAELWRLYHHNSKLREATARRQAESFAVTPRELFVASRGFKQFRNARAVALPPPAPAGRSLDDVLRARRSSRELARPLALGELATVLQHGLGPSAIVSDGEHGVDQLLRTWPSAGGLYPLDAYVLAARVDDLSPAVYHYNVPRAELERVAAPPDLDERLAAAFFHQDFAAGCAAAVVLVAAFDRSVGKYGERGYRLVLLDAGHAAQNVLLCAEELELAALPMAGFSDAELESLLELDGSGESVVHTVLLGGASR